LTKTAPLKGCGSRKERKEERNYGKRKTSKPLCGLVNIL
jgi:hypothetical protein